ncbi:MAG: thioredoxin domain-containing protein [Rhizomicrobium sp.]
MMRNLSLLIVASVIGAGWAAGTALADPAPKLPYATMAQLPIVSMHVYDEKADADKVVDAALQRARKDHKLLLIDLGGNWCPDCVVMHNLMLVPAMQKFIDAHYEVALVDVGKFDRNPQIAARYGYTTRLKGVPTILVVNPQTNKVINSEQVFALSNAGHQTPQDLADYLARWTATSPN